MSQRTCPYPPLPTSSAAWNSDHWRSGMYHAGLTLRTICTAWETMKNTGMNQLRFVRCTHVLLLRRCMWVWWLHPVSTSGSAGPIELIPLERLMSIWFRYQLVPTVVASEYCPSRKMRRSQWHPSAFQARSVPVALVSFPDPIGFHGDNSISYTQCES
jgi:hypothetical protein